MNFSFSKNISTQSALAKSRYVMPFAYCFFAMGIYFSLIYYYRYESKILSVFCLLASFSVLILQLIRKKIQSHLFSANYLIVAAFLTIEMLTIYTGGIKASSIWWLGLIPVVAAFLLNAYYCIFWFIVTLINIVIVSYLKRVDLLPTNVVPLEGMDKFLTTSTVFGIILITILCILADILRERASVEKEELQNKSFRLTQLASLGNLAAGVSHEINNPLSVIKGSLTFINRQIQEEAAINKADLSHYLEKIERSVKRIQDVTFSMRSISEQEDNRTIGPINIHEVLNSIIISAKERIGEKNIQIKLNITQDQLYFSGIYNEIFKAINVIVENALDELVETSAGVIEISSEKAGSKIVIYIKDNGRGIPADVRNKIFDPFFTTKPVGRSTGLGLTYSLNVIAFNGGTLELIPETTNGSLFKITLPSYGI